MSGNGIDVDTTELLPLELARLKELLHRIDGGGVAALTDAEAYETAFLAAVGEGDLCPYDKPCPHGVRFAGWDAEPQCGCCACGRAHVLRVRAGGPR